MIKKEKKEISTLTRNEIIHNNFFKILKEKNITNAQYAKDNNIDKTTLSKWKNHTTNMSPDQIYQAAQYFEITVNDLYYSSYEKKEIQLLTETNYMPVDAKQSIDIKIYYDQFKNPLSVIWLTIIALILTLAISCIEFDSSETWIFMSILIPVSAFYSYKTVFNTKKTFIIDYLDDIYYEIKNVKNQFFIANSILHFISIALVVTNCFLIFKTLDTNNSYFIFMLFLIICMMLYCLIGVFTLFGIDMKYKKEIYDFEITSYNCSLVNFYAMLFIFGISIMPLSKEFTSYWLYSLLLLLGTICSLIEFVLVSKKYSEYNIVYKKYKSTAEILFPKD